MTGGAVRVLMDRSQTLSGPTRNVRPAVQQINNPLLQQLFSKTSLPLAPSPAPRAAQARDPYQTHFLQVTTRDCHGSIYDCRGVAVVQHAIGRH